MKDIPFFSIHFPQFPPFWNTQRCWLVAKATDQKQKKKEKKKERISTFGKKTLSLSLFLSPSRDDASFLTLKTSQDEGKRGEVAVTRARSRHGERERSGETRPWHRDGHDGTTNSAGSLKGNFSASVSLSLEIIRRGWKGTCFWQGFESSKRSSCGDGGILHEGNAWKRGGAPAKRRISLDEVKKRGKNFWHRPRRVWRINNRRLLNSSVDC